MPGKAGQEFQRGREIGCCTYEKNVLQTVLTKLMQENLQRAVIDERASLTTILKRQRKLKAISILMRR